MPAHSYRKAGICVFMIKVHLGSQDNFIKLIHLFRSFSIKFVHVLFFFKVDELREAIEELFYFEFVLDDIPIWGFVGYLEESGFLPHSHKVLLLCLHVNCSDKGKKYIYT